MLSACIFPILRISAHTQSDDTSNHAFIGLNCSASSSPLSVGGVSSTGFSLRSLRLASVEVLLLAMVNALVVLAQQTTMQRRKRGQEKGSVQKVDF